MDHNNYNINEQNEDTQEGKFLTFHVGKEEYALSIRYITEIIGMQKITDLPETPVYIKGVINLRGKVIPLVDIRLRFGFEEREYDERTCIIVTNVNENSVGLIVDLVKDVLDIPNEQISSPPEVQKGALNKYIQGLGRLEDVVVIILNIEKLLYDEELNVSQDVSH